MLPGRISLEPAVFGSGALVRSCMLSKQRATFSRRQIR